MVKVKILRGDEYLYITLQEMLDIYYKEVPSGWVELIKNEFDGALKIQTPNQYDEFIEKHKHLLFFLKKKFDPTELKRFYDVLKVSKYNTTFDEDILKFISYLKELSFFDIIGYKVDDYSPNLDDWLNSKNPFNLGYSKEELKNLYSITDLLPLKYGMNAIRGQLLKALKKIF